jgi:hypothetical protein
VGEPICHQEGVELACRAIVEADDELATVWSEALQRMRIARRKIPNVTFLDVRDVWQALWVEHRDSAIAVGHKRPFGRLVPMQFADATGGQSHIHAGDGRRNREVRLRHLPRPTAVLDAAWRGIERGPDLRYPPNVGGRRRKCRRQLISDRGVLRPWISDARWIFGVNRALRGGVRIAERSRGCCRGGHRGTCGCCGEDIASREHCILLALNVIVAHLPYNLGSQ